MRRLLGPFLALAALCGCGPTCPATRMPRSDLLWQGASRPALTSMRAEAAVDQRGPEGRIKGRVMMFIQRPDEVRFDAMSQFGPVAILTSDGQRFQLADLKEKRFIEGDSCPANIARMLGVHLSSREVLGLLFAELPAASVEARPARCEDGAPTVRQSAPGGGQFIARFDYDADTGAARLAKVAREDAQGQRLWDVEYEDYRAVGESVVLPRVVRLRDRRNESELLIRFKDVDVNVDVPAGAFSQQPRPGLTREEVTCP